MRGLSIPFNRWTHRAKELKHPDLGQDTAEAGFQLQADFKGLSGSPGSRMALYPPPVPPAWTPGSLSTRQNLGSEEGACEMPAPGTAGLRPGVPGLCAPEVSARGSGLG